MTKINFIALAEYVKTMLACGQITNEGVLSLADFCYRQNSAFNRDRWLGYIAGRNGKNGGKVK